MRPSLVLTASAASMTLASSNPGANSHLSVVIDIEKRDQLQRAVTWDEDSLFIRGERVMIFSGEIHPFRLPVPSLYIDLFQKVKALGLNTVSFYVDWALVEGKPGDFNADGIFGLQPFFDAALAAGVYLIARPGPYINAEVSGGGFPGWLARSGARLRTSDAAFLNATENYMARVCDIIAKAQITNDGPVILFQPENEYTNFEKGREPEGEYFQHVIDQARKAGIVVPMISNDARPEGHNAPATGVGSVDIYGHDGYPLGFDCANPRTWLADRLPTKYHSLHQLQSPNTPYSIMEFQGGSFDPWGGNGFDKCADLVNHEYERVFYKNNMAAGVSIFNIYMASRLPRSIHDAHTNRQAAQLFGGTNWGNLGHPGGYTSYDYGAAIKEDRSIDREKYSELKLQAQFLKVSPSYLTAKPGNSTVGVYSDNVNITVTPLLGQDNSASYYVVRHTNYSSLSLTDYTLNLPTSAGKMSVPHFSRVLQLRRRDSKVHVVDYPVGNMTLVYSTAEIFTWKRFEDRTVLLVYGRERERHEMCIHTRDAPVIAEGGDVDYSYKRENLVLSWEATRKRRVVQVNHLQIYLLERESAYAYWVPDLPGSQKHQSYGTSVMNPDSLIIKGGYLIRSVSTKDDTLRIQADFNKTASLEIIGVARTIKAVEINGNKAEHTQNGLSNWVVEPSLEPANLSIPDLKTLRWKSINSLPETDPSYNDSAWLLADHTTTNNTAANLSTPVSLFASDYGFHAGAVLYRGTFISNGKEVIFNVTTRGGSGFASSVWLNDTFLGSFPNSPDAAGDNTAEYRLPNLTPGAAHVLTVVVDTMGLEENFIIATDVMKTPRGIMRYGLVAPSGAQTNMTSWKIRGNLGGESYADGSRGPLNEGGLFFERQGYHLPGAPAAAFGEQSPFDGTDEAGVMFYTAALDLDLPSDRFDIPLSFVFDDITSPDDVVGLRRAYRAMLYVNGFQYGRYVSNIGPQTRFPVPEGILRYRGTNTIGLAIWALGKGGAKVRDFRLEVDGTAVTTGRDRVKDVKGGEWTDRQGAT